MKKIKEKKLLITAGPTWVPIDDVRVISNIATGETGFLLAKEAVKKGFRVTLILGPVCAVPLNKAIKIIRYKFFQELKNSIKKELRLMKYDYVIHSAAVSDFRPAHVFNGKLGSEKTIHLTLKPLPKIFKDIARFSAGAKLIMFKLESGVSNDALIKRAKVAQDKVGAEIMVANRLNPYRAFVIDKNGGVISANSKNELVKKLVNKISF